MTNWTEVKAERDGKKMNTLIELKTLLIAINYIRYLDCLTITYLTTCMPT